jgi:hypothetical protein
VPSSLRIIVTGLIAQHPRLGGVAWDYLNVALGLRRLGHDVFYVEDSGEWPYLFEGVPGTDWTAHEPSENVETLARVMDRFGLGDRWAYRCPLGPRWYGVSEAVRRRLLESAELLIDVSGTLERPAEYRHVPRMVYLDTDPVFTQIDLANGEPGVRERVDVYDVHFSIGECIAKSGLATGHDWRPTKQPIVLSEWETRAQPRPVFTTVMSWTSYRPLVHEGRTYGQKDLELRQLLELPARVRARFEIAMGRTEHVRWESENAELPPAVREVLTRHPDWKPRQLLEHFGWRVRDAVEVVRNFQRYRDFVGSSRAEWSVAKNGYVRGRSGWFSGRSACYLAAGRPVVVQDTGLASVLPLGRGVLTFSDLEQAIDGVRAVDSDYARHARAAREIAAEYFDSDKVLTRFVSDAMSQSGG